MPAATIEQRLRDAKFDMIAHAERYCHEGGSEETWRALCRAKATIDALRRCAR